MTAPHARATAAVLVLLAGCVAGRVGPSWPNATGDSPMHWLSTMMSSRTIPIPSCTPPMSSPSAPAPARHFTAAEHGFQRVIDAGEVYTLGALAQLYADADRNLGHALRLARENLEWKRDHEAWATLKAVEARFAERADDARCFPPQFLSACQRPLRSFCRGVSNGSAAACGAPRCAPATFPLRCCPCLSPTRFAPAASSHGFAPCGRPALRAPSEVATVAGGSVQRGLSAIRPRSARCTCGAAVRPDDGETVLR